MADLVNDPHWHVLCTRSGSDRSSQKRSPRGGLVLGWCVSRHAQRVFLCQRFDVILIPISDKVTLISFDAGVYSASLEGEKWMEGFIEVGSVCPCRESMFRLLSRPCLCCVQGLRSGESACHQGCESLLRDEALQTVSCAQQAHLRTTRPHRFSSLSTATDRCFHPGCCI